MGQGELHEGYGTFGMVRGVVHLTRNRRDHLYTRTVLVRVKNCFRSMRLISHVLCFYVKNTRTKNRPKHVKTPTIDDSISTSKSCRASHQAHSPVSTHVCSNVCAPEPSGRGRHQTLREATTKPSGRGHQQAFSNILKAIRER